MYQTHVPITYCHDFCTDVERVEIKFQITNNSKS